MCKLVLIVGLVQQTEYYAAGHGYPVLPRFGLLGIRGRLGAYQPVYIGREVRQAFFAGYFFFAV